MPASFFIVRATIADPSRRAAFDDWYRNEHLPDALKSFGAQKAWRCWSDIDPSVHIATYRFADRAALDHGTRPEVMKRLVADFDRAWPGIPRTREIMTLVEEVGGGV
jgi:hypothetical protein